MKHKFTARKTISVHVEEAEWKWIELQADGNVSEWCRELLLADYPADLIGAQVEVEEAPKRRRVVVKGKKAENPKKSCRHGKTVGEYCGFCYGPAKME